MASFRPRLVRSSITALVVVAAAALGFAATNTSASAASLGPCDLYAAGGTPCVAAHSTTRALYAAYTGPLYQLRRATDGATTDVAPVAAGSYANAATQDNFCRATSCVITTIYDQSGRGNSLTQAPAGYFNGPAAGGADNLADATAAPAKIGGHKVYGVFVAPGTGYRNNTTNGIATGDNPEGMYAVLDGTHYNGECCFDYGNAETDSHDDGNGTMEAIYFGNSTVWGTGTSTGPWIMADLENGLFSGVHTKQNNANHSVRNRFTTAMVKGSADAWAIRGGNAQSGFLDTLYTGARPNEVSGYNPMHKQGAIILGIGGDNSNGSAGTFYEGVMTSGYPTESTENAVQNNITAQKYTAIPVALDKGTKVSIRSTITRSGSSYIQHDADDDAVSVTPLSSSSAANDRSRATFVETKGIANPACVSFEATDEPGSYLRHAGFVLHIQRNDGSSLFGQDATFCAKVGNAGTGTSFQSFNFPDKYLRAFQGAMYVASNGGTNAWDARSGWLADTTFSPDAPLT